MLSREEYDRLRDLWQDDCRKMIPDLELLDSDRMLKEISRVRGVCGMTGCSDVEVVVHVLRNLDEDKSRVPPHWWWITASLLILDDIVCHPWYEVCWYVYNDMRGMREMTTLWGSASVSKTSFFAAMALTNMVVWHGDAHVYITSPYKNAGSDKIWRALTKRTDQWAKHPPPWVNELSLSIESNKDEITVRNSKGRTSTAAFVALETTASIQGKKRERFAGDTKFEPKRGIILLVGDEIILNPVACANLTAGEGNLVSNSNVMSWVGMNPLPHQVRHPNALDLSAPVSVSIDALNEHKDFTWRTIRGRLLRFCMANSPNRFTKEPVFDFLINDEQAEAATKRGESNYQAQVAAWGWSGGMGNGGVLTVDAINIPALQTPPIWTQPPSRCLFVDLAFGGRDPAGYCCLEFGVCLEDGEEKHVISGVEHEKLTVQRNWVPTSSDITDFERLAKERGGKAPALEPGVEIGANCHMVLQILRTASRLGIPKGRVSFDSSLRPDVTMIALQALGTVPWYYSGSRPLREDEVGWPLYPPVLKPDGSMTKWSDLHHQMIGAAWRFAEHVIARGRVAGLFKLKRGTTELISRMWVSGAGSKTDVEGKKKLAVSPMFGETLCLGLTFAVRFCGALPDLSKERPLRIGSGSEFESSEVFQLRSRKVSASIWS